MWFISMTREMSECQNGWIINVCEDGGESRVQGQKESVECESANSVWRVVSGALGDHTVERERSCW